ncbi:sulfatase family protein [Tichowtungia aerotolerans]|uniref:Sulfatase-like hydrolase/transferase n=1 Tax=Tichowtungia aerotolerans TaxID=2697043 RepID=A0A6P1MCC2_9BACT|nr:arylsulfatase [Tichowtungia aerotolerans]QHI69718.1 sulfatase-like hydrolase/transferase [Tichowtungia aerotolerans]
MILAVVRTPHLNRLAEQGMRFTNANTPASVCSPTRYALLTGRYAWRGPLPFGVVGINDPLTIEPDRPTVGGLMKRSGYRTAQIGKWHLGYGDRMLSNPAERIDHLSPGPNDLGFDYHFGLPQNLDDPLRVWIENDGIYGLRSLKISQYAHSFYGGTYAGFDAPQRSREEATEFLTERASDWIRKVHRDKPDQPFFLYFAPPAVHHPIVPSETMRGTSDCGAYGDFIQDLDLSVGRLIGTLAYEGILDDTLVIFTADNGADLPDSPNQPEIRARQAGLLANGPLRGDKHRIYEGGMRVPLIVRWPGRVPAGSVADHMVNIVDIYATLANVLSDRLKDGEAPDSFSFLPTLLGEEQPDRRSMVSDSEAGILALRSGTWKYIEGKFPDSMSANHKMRAGYFRGEDERALYDLVADPGEQHNLIGEYPEVAEQMQKTLDAYRKNGKSR